MQSSCPDLIVNRCPLGCENCNEIYVNEQTGHRILCRCSKCHHKTDGKHRKISNNNFNENKSQQSSKIFFKTAAQLLKEQENGAGFSNKPAKDDASKEYAYDEHYTLSD